VLGNFSAVAIAAFAIAYVLAPRARLFGYVALGLAVIAIVIEELPALAEAFAKRSTNPAMIGSTQDNAIAATMLIPAAVMLLIQWAFIRRRWLVARGVEYRTRWPWITIAFAGLVGLNPLGIELIGSALRQSVTDYFATLAALIVLCAVGLLATLGALEIFLRRRHLARRNDALAAQAGS
jgi:hypothetical protein